MSKRIEFTWDDRTLEPKEFIQRFSEKLPLLIQVVEGYTDECEEHAYSNGDVYWITHIKKTCKIIFKTIGGQHLSMPADYSLRFHLLDDDGKEGEAQSLGHLAECLESGDIIVPENDGAVDFQVGAAHEMIKQRLGQLTYVAQYDERTLVGNLVESANHLLNECVVIPAFINIPLVLANGLENGTQEDFEASLQGLRMVSQRFHNDRVKIHTEIMLYEGDIKHLKEKDYDYIKPSNYMKCNQGQLSLSPVGHGGPVSTEDSDDSEDVFVLTTSPIYDSRVPALPPRPHKKDSRRLSTPIQHGDSPRKLPAVPPRTRRSHSVPVLLDPDGIEESTGAYEDLVEIQGQVGAGAKPKKSGSFKKYGSHFGGTILKHIKKPFTQVAVVKPRVKQSNTEGEDDNAYDAVDQPPPVPKHPKHKGKKKKKKPGFNKELPPLPDTSEEEEPDYEPTEFILSEESQEQSNPSILVGSDYSLEQRPKLQLPPTASSTSPGVYISMKKHSISNPRPPPRPVRSLSTENTPVKARQVQSTDIYDVATVPKPLPRAPVLQEAVQTSSEIDNLTQVPDNLSGLSVADICQCLRLLKLGQFVESFEAENIDGNKIRMFTRKQLITEFHMNTYECTRLLNFVEEGWRPKFV